MKENLLCEQKYWQKEIKQLYDMIIILVINLISQCELWASYSNGNYKSH